MEQLHTFSDINRDSAGRVISIAYFALINIADYSEHCNSVTKQNGFPSTRCRRWFSTTRKWC